MAATSTYTYTGQNPSSSSSQRAIAMGLALVSAIILSPLYVTRKNDHHHHHRHHHTIFHNETRYWNSGFVLPMVLAVLIIAIKTTSSPSMERGARAWVFPSPDPSWVLRIGGSSWGLAGILAMLMLVLYWQDSVQDFFWR